MRRRDACRSFVKRTAEVLSLGFAAALLLAAQPAPIPLPPMGWSSWNSFSNTVDAHNVMDQARAMAANGMQKAGYIYVNIDEGWWTGSRDPQGNIIVDPKQWPALAPGEHPGDMSNIVRFIHKLGLKAGIYTDAGMAGCSMYPDLGPKYFHAGSEGHYEQDFLQFARWGFDYVKVDWCGGDNEHLDPAVQYAQVARAIAHAVAVARHPLYFSICEWGKNSPWTWAPHLAGSPANIWRTSGDIVPPIVAGHEHADRKASFAKMLANFDQGIHPQAQHTGAYNDPDMMVLGMPGLTESQNRLHMALWAISGAPLIAGADLTKLTQDQLSDLTNPTVVAIDQDPAGLQAVKIAEPSPGLQIWAKPLAQSGRRAVLLLNRTPSAQSISLKWTDLGLSAAKPAIHDAWSGAPLQAAGDACTTTVPAGDGVLLLIAGQDLRAIPYKPSEPTGAVLPMHPVQFVNVHARSAIERIKILYKNPGPKTRFATLQVNGEVMTTVAFPPTRTNPAAYVWIQANLNPGESGNILVFSTDCNPGPVIYSIAVQ